MLNVALTGNVAAGKSTVTELFRRWGATVVDSDAVVRDLQQPGAPVLQAMVEEFGPGILTDAGTLDRAAVRRLIVADDDARTRLNALVHPAVRTRRLAAAAEARARGDRILVSDIPLLFEAADPAEFDLIVLVDAPEAVRRTRLVERGLTEADSRALMAAQAPAAPKRHRSDYVIDNSGTLSDLELAARTVWRAIEARASADTA